jgi:micrococcal nuclease
MYQYKAYIKRVIDGDTVEAVVDLGFDIKVTKSIRIIAENHDYFDTPETWRPKTESERTHGEQAKQRAIELLEGKSIILDSVKEGKYRYVAKIKLDNNIDYGDLMINEGYQKRDSYSD